MNWLDYAFLGVIGVSVLIGVIRGFVREVISVITWIAAFWVAIRYSPEVSALAADWVASPMLQLVIAFGALFVATLLVGALAGWLARLLVGRTGLSGTDRTLGVVFGGLRGGVLVGLIVLGAGMTALPEEPWWQESVIAGAYRPWVCDERIGDWLEAAGRHESLAQAPMNGSAAVAYWQAWCGTGPLDGDKGRG